MTQSRPRHGNCITFLKRFRGFSNISLSTKSYSLNKILLNKILHIPTSQPTNPNLFLHETIHCEIPRCRPQLLKHNTGHTTHNTAAQYGATGQQPIQSSPPTDGAGTAAAAPSSAVFDGSPPRVSPDDKRGGVRFNASLKRGVRTARRGSHGRGGQTIVHDGRKSKTTNEKHQKMGDEVCVCRATRVCRATAGTESVYLCPNHMSMKRYYY